ncbi:hypothetical protein [Streptomyces lancefieldiae]|uniref:Recombinase family protein n=1 Tax=Streptomyces lancefieldiae TaxID=3075520 RepID=A0ABU3B193_9ACTN|nr:hypothetical protein [Streptomyces sp. DSM 40712]MDT0616219.1 hypothetical protein [Streptomyces sp. DSM 40712]
MRQSTTRRTQTWTHRERVIDSQLHPDQIRVQPDPFAPLAGARREHLGRVVTQIQAKGRLPRVCLYALSVRGQEPQHSVRAAAAYAVRHSWQVVTRQPYTDRQGLAEPALRPGWRLVRQQIRAGYADGVVTVTPSVISSRVDEVRQEIDWFGQHFGFIALVVPEMTRAQV